MKKLMITLAAVAMAAVAQAVSVDWSASKIYVGDDSATSAANYLCYMFVNESYSASSLASELALANFANLSKAETSTDSSTLMEGTTYTSSLAVSADPYNAYLVVFNAATAGAATKFFMTDVGDYDLVISGAADSIDFEKQGRYADDWTAINVPEPTSGLLLLIGMAGLALRRKQK